MLQAMAKIVIPLLAPEASHQCTTSLLQVLLGRLTRGGRDNMIRDNGWQKPELESIFVFVSVPHFWMRGKPYVSFAQKLSH